MQKSDIAAKLRAYILETFLFTEEDDAFSNDDSFLEKGIIDSTGILEVIEYIGDEFGVSAEDDELVPENLDSVNNLAVFIQRKSIALKTGLSPPYQLIIANEHRILSDGSMKAEGSVHAGLGRIIGNT